MARPKSNGSPNASTAAIGMAGFVLANGSMSSNQFGDCPARSAMKTPKAKPQSLPRQRDIRRALIEADLVDTALRDSAIPRSEAIPKVLSEAKNNMVALPRQLFYSTPIKVCLWFLAKNKAVDAKRGFRDPLEAENQLAFAPRKISFSKRIQ